MKHISLFCLALVLGAEASAAPATPPPLLPPGDFTTLVEASGVTISPDGATLAYEFGDDHERVLVFREWESGRVSRIGGNAGYGTPVWVNSQRVIFGRGSATDIGGKDLLPAVALPSSVIFNRFEGARRDDVLVLRYDREVMGRYQPFFVLPHPRIERVDTRRAIAVRLEDNPGKVTSWMIDGAGTVRIAIETDGVLQRVLYREKEGAPWRVPKDLDWAKDRVRPQWLSADGNLLYCGLVTPAGTWGVHAYDLVKEAWADLILSHDRYDIAWAMSPVLAPKSRALLGIYYAADRTKPVWFDAQLAAVQAAVDASLPRMTNVITSLSDDLQRMVIRSFSDRDPGAYYQFDLPKKELKPLFVLRPWIKAAQMAEMFEMSFKARDGLTVRGYITLPAGREAKQLPLVLLVHDGPWTRDAWGFNANVQFLANRGYAVLQINYRGSRGFGEAFHEMGKRRVGRELQQDIADAARWAIEQGVADPARIGIMGEGFGGFSALLGVTQNPGLYRCAVSIDGVTDWAALLDYSRRVHLAGYDAMKDHFGDPVADAAELAEISPINHIAELSAPVLMIFGNDERVPRENARAYLAAIKRARKPHEVFTNFDEIDGLRSAKVRTEMLRRIEAFLARNLSKEMRSSP